MITNQLRKTSLSTLGLLLMLTLFMLLPIAMAKLTMLPLLLAAARAVVDVKEWINEYFQATGENKKDYIDQIKGTKMNDIDWTKAHKDATHWDALGEVFRNSTGFWSTKRGNEYYVELPSHDKRDLSIDRYIARPVEKPVFTQAMADAGELPNVGMECNFDTSFFTDKNSNNGICEIIAYFKDKVWINIINFECVININVIDFKPIDTRSDKEKAIDYMEYSYKKGNSMADVLNEIHKGYVHGVKWVGK